MTNDNVKETTTLTDEQLDTVVEELAENLSADDKLIRDIIENEATPNAELESEIVNVSVDNDTGELKYMDQNRDPLKNTDLPVSDIATGELEKKNDELSKEALEDAVNSHDLNDEEAQQFISVLLKYQSGIKFNIYEEIPDPIKKYVDSFVQAAAREGKQVTKNQVAKFLLDEFISETRSNKEFVDFQSAIEKELQIPSITDLYTEHIREIMEGKLLESADNLEAEYPDKAKALRDISSMFTDSYQFGIMKSTLVNNKKARNKIRESEKEYNKYCNAFNARNMSTIVKINDVFMVAKTLNRVLPDDISLEDIKKFVVLFCKTCEQLDVTNTVHCSYMYYTIKNIISLDYAAEAKTEFSQTLINNIIDTIKYINTVQQQVEASMPEKLLKKKIKKCR